MYMTYMSYMHVHNASYLYRTECACFSLHTIKWNLSTSVSHANSDISELTSSINNTPGTSSATP